MEIIETGSSPDYLVWAVVGVLTITQILGIVKNDLPTTIKALSISISNLTEHMTNHMQRIELNQIRTEGKIDAVLKQKE